MTRITIEIRSDDGFTSNVIQDIVGRKSYFGSFLLTDAISTLIMQADTNGWEKSDNELQPAEFYNAILTAIAKHYSYEGLPLPPEQTALDILRMMIDDLGSQGLLKKKLTDESGSAFYNDD